MYTYTCAHAAVICMRSIFKWLRPQQFPCAAAAGGKLLLLSDLCCCCFYCCCMSPTTPVCCCCCCCYRANWTKQMAVMPSASVAEQQAICCYCCAVVQQSCLCLCLKACACSLCPAGHTYCAEQCATRLWGSAGLAVSVCLPLSHTPFSTLLSLDFLCSMRAVRPPVHIMFCQNYNNAALVLTLQL
jgi:hypothetical protein